MHTEAIDLEEIVHGLKVLPRNQRGYPKHTHVYSSWQNTRSGMKEKQLKIKSAVQVTNIPPELPISECDQCRNTN